MNNQLLLDNQPLLVDNQLLIYIYIYTVLDNQLLDNIGYDYWIINYYWINQPLLVCDLSNLGSGLVHCGELGSSLHPGHVTNPLGFPGEISGLGGQVYDLEMII